MLTLEIIKAIDQQVDSDEFLQNACQVAHLARKVSDSQMRNLQNIVNATNRFSEILNFVKSQTGRHPKDWRDLGPAIIENLMRIDQYAQKIVKHYLKPQNSPQCTPDQEADCKGEVRLRLCRHWTKMVVAEFLYYKACQEARHG